MNENQMKDMISQIVSEMIKEKGMGTVELPEAAAGREPEKKALNIEDDFIPDLSAVDFRKINSTPNPANLEEFMRIKEKTSARIGVWRTGPRARSETYLRFRADHAAAMDAVFTDVDEELLKEQELFVVKTKCRDKDEFLTRPDLGAEFDEETKNEIKARCTMNPDIQVYFADGLSSSSIEANLRDLLPSLKQGLANSGLSIGTPFFVKYGRVRSMDVIAETLGAKVTAVCIGERPGLATSESLSVYMCYGAHVGINEANRTIVSNIYNGGTNPAEAGAYVAELLVRMAKEKASGIDFKI